MDNLTILKIGAFAGLLLAAVVHLFVRVGSDESFDDAEQESAVRTITNVLILMAFLSGVGLTFLFLANFT